MFKILSKTDKKLSDLTKVIPKYHSTPEMRIDCDSDEEKFKITKKAVVFFTNNFECITTDGVRIKFKDGWGLVRSSNTQPVIVCRFEAKTKEKLQEYKQLVLNQLSKFGNINYVQ